MAVAASGDGAGYDYVVVGSAPAAARWRQG